MTWPRSQQAWDADQDSRSSWAPNSGQRGTLGALAAVDGGQGTGWGVIFRARWLLWGGLGLWSRPQSELLSRRSQRRSPWDPEKQPRVSLQGGPGKLQALCLWRGIWRAGGRWQGTLTPCWEGHLHSPSLLPLTMCQRAVTAPAPPWASPPPEKHHSVTGARNWGVILSSLPSPLPHLSPVLSQTLFPQHHHHLISPALGRSLWMVSLLSYPCPPSSWEDSSHTQA